MRHKLLPVIALALAGLTGCGGLNPGIAAQVGGDRITEQKVATYTRDLCEARTRDLKAQNEVHANYQIARTIVQMLVLRSAAEQFADEQGAKPGLAYAQKLRALQGTAAKLPAGQGEAIAVIGTTVEYVQDVMRSAGEKILAAEGDAAPSVDDSQAAGKSAFATWVANNPAKIDPKYDLAFGDATIIGVDNTTSYAWSEQAKAGRGTDQAAYAAYVDSLADNQVCGR